MLERLNPLASLILIITLAILNDNFHRVICGKLNLCVHILAVNGIHVVRRRFLIHQRHICVDFTGLLICFHDLLQTVEGALSSPQAVSIRVAIAMIAAAIFLSIFICRTSNVK